MKIDDLKASTINPRKMTSDKKAALKKSLKHLGDLGGIIYNERSKTLVGGHQRTDALKGAIIKIVEKFDPPTKTGTVSIGYAEIDGEKFSYRSVDWDKKTETEALLAANRHSGEWDEELLRINFAEVPDLDLELTGFDLEDLEELNIEIPTINMFDEGFMDEPEETDAQYMKKNKGPEEEADRERLPDMLNRKYPKDDNEPAEVKEISKDDAFGEAGQETTVNKRFVIIIDCKDDVMKKDLKEKLKPLVEEAKANFF